MAPPQEARVGSPGESPPTEGETTGQPGGWDLDDIDLDALAVEIIELMRRELRIELERQGRAG
jgi:hypothetical protein